MHVVLRQGSMTVALHAAPDSRGGAAFREAQSATRFLRAFQGDPVAMIRLRHIAAQFSGMSFERMGDVELMRYLSRALTTGRIQLGGVVERRATFVDADEELPPAPPAPSRAAASSTPARTPSEPSMFDANFDAGAQAAALRQAAVSGVPFCEECERRRRERAASAA